MKMSDVVSINEMELMRLQPNNWRKKSLLLNFWVKAGKIK
jgi:hypothetical protein